MANKQKLDVSNLAGILINFLLISKVTGIINGLFFPPLIFKYYQISTSWRSAGCIKNPKFPTMLKCENIPVGSLIITGLENETIPLFKSLRVNSLGRGAVRHVQPSTNRVNINHRWNISHVHDTFYPISYNLKEGKMKWMIMVLMKVESVWEAGNDFDRVWIRNKQYLIKIACGLNVKKN